MDAMRPEHPIPADLCDLAMAPLRPRSGRPAHRLENHQASMGLAVELPVSLARPASTPARSSDVEA
jgi:hypothetical protein